MASMTSSFGGVNVMGSRKEMASSSHLTNSINSIGSSRQTTRSKGGSVFNSLRDDEDDPFAFNSAGSVGAKPHQQSLFHQSSPASPSHMFPMTSTSQQQQSAAGGGATAASIGFHQQLHMPTRLLQPHNQSIPGFTHASLSNEVPSSSVAPAAAPLYAVGGSQHSPNREMFNSPVIRRPGPIGNNTMGGMSTNPVIVKRPSSVQPPNMSNVGMPSAAGFGGYSQRANHQEMGPPSFDPSDFPTLSVNSRSSSTAASTGSSQRAPSYVNLMNKPQSDTSQEFQIENEDFPALPGQQNKPTSYSGEVVLRDKGSTSPGGIGVISDQVNSMQVQVQPKLLPISQQNQQAQSNSSQQLLSSSQQREFLSASTGQRRGIHVTSDGKVTNIPQGMITDQFGIAGLLSFLRASERDQQLSALALGSDLTTMGLNLNSPDNLYPTFGGPWTDQICRPQDLDFNVPQEYHVNAFIRGSLASIKLNRYGEDLLFYLFYTSCQDVLQLAAASELYSRDWRYHKEEKVWMTRAGPVEKTTSYESGNYYFWDYTNWRKVMKEYHLQYDKLEDRPVIPSTSQSQHQDQLQQASK